MGAQAEVIETAIDEAKKNEIVKNYEKMHADLEELQEAARFWGEVDEHPEFKEFIDGLNADLAEQRERWDNIKPGDFRDSQSRVRAIKIVTLSLTDKNADVAESLKAKKRLIYNYEIENEIFLRAAGYEFEGEPEEEGGEGEQKADDDGGIPEGTEAIVVEVSKAGLKNDILMGSFEYVGFVQGSKKNLRKYIVGGVDEPGGWRNEVSKFLSDNKAFIDEVRFS